MFLKKVETTYRIDGINTIPDSELDQQKIRVLSRTGDSIRLIHDNKTYDAIIKDFDPQLKKALVNISGINFQITIEEPIDLLINELGFLKSSKHSVKEIKSPMPGLVVQIFVEEGQSVEEGQKLLSLEAMKMENILKSPGEGVIKSILTTEGNSVDKNQILIEFE